MQKPKMPGQQTPEQGYRSQTHTAHVMSKYGMRVINLDGSTISHVIEQSSVILDVPGFGQRS